MIALFCLCLALFVSPFKSKSRLEAENAALLSFPKIPSARIRAMRQNQASSDTMLAVLHCLGRLSSTCSSRRAGLKSRTSFFGISSILP